MSLYTGFCVKCRSKKEFNNATIKTNKKGVRYAQGNCETCQTKINRFLPSGENEYKEVVKKVKKVKKCNCQN